MPVHHPRPLLSKKMLSRFALEPLAAMESSISQPCRTTWSNDL
jgi:hypothetical protein